MLGTKHPYRYSHGYGYAHPKVVDNGGDPSGIVNHIRWDHWGASTARGYGLGYGYKPGGGYYRKQVRTQFKAEKIGRCSAHGRRAYTRLVARQRTSPNSTHWTKWQRFGPAPTLCSAD